MLKEVTISSIFRGHNATRYFTVDGGYDSSIGVDPDFDVSGQVKTSGILCPTRFEKFSGNNVDAAPLWMIMDYKDTNLYNYLANGEIIRYDKNLANETKLTKPTDGLGNGACYYNNYIYFATPTNIARYGPMDGTPTLTQNAWTSALLGSQPPLSNATYPTIRGVKIPNHAMVAHADNQMYICDVKEGQGVIHSIKTTKGATEGSDDDGSAYNVLDLPSGWSPTCIESWGTWLVIGAIQTTDDKVNQGPAAIFLWSTTDPDTFEEGPIFLSDPYVTALKNINGIIYIWSGNSQNGVRLSKYIGDQSVVEIAYTEEGTPPLAGAVDALGNRLNWGAWTSYPEESASVMAFGSKKGNLPKGIHNVARATAPGTNKMITSIKYAQQKDNVRPSVIIGWKDDDGRAGIDKISVSSEFNSVWRSEMFNIGQTFDIKEIRIPLAKKWEDGAVLDITVLGDDLSISKTIKIDATNQFVLSKSKRFVRINESSLRGIKPENNLMLEIKWTGTRELPVALPIRIILDIDGED